MYSQTITLLIRVVLLGSFLLGSFFARGQKKDIQFEHISIDHGLSQSSVNCIMQDRLGFMWFGTKDGLNKFDGYDFTVYKYEPHDTNALSSNFISAIVQAENEDIWIATHGGGLNRYNYVTGAFDHFFYDADALDIPPQSYISSLCLVGNTLWIGTIGSGLIAFDTQTYDYSIYRHDPDDSNSIADDFIRFVLKGSKGSIWVGTEYNGVSKLDVASEKFTNYDVISPRDQHSIANNKMRGGEIGPDGTLWVGSERGLFKFETQQDSFIPIDFAIDLHIAANAIIQADDETLWVGAHNKGLFKYNPKTDTYQHFKHETHNPNSLHVNAINVLNMDRSGNLWIGIDGGGIDKVNLHQKFNLYTYSPEYDYSLTSNSIRAIMEDHQGQLYIGTYTGLSRFDRKNKTATHFEVNNEDTANYTISSAVYALLEDHNHEIWIGYEGSGIQRYNPKTGKFKGYTVAKGDLLCDDIYRIYQDAQNRIWICSREGLSVYQPETDAFKTILQHRETLRDLPVRTIVQDDERYFWVGTDMGLYYVDALTGDHKVFLSSSKNYNTINNNRIKSLHMDDEQVLWIGTEGGGLNKLHYINTGLEFDTIVLSTFSEDEDLNNAVIYGILEDDTENLWLSTNNGLLQLDEQTHRSTRYTYADGLQSNEFNSGAYYKSPSGKMYFGGINGLNSFYPDQLTINQQPPPVVITGLDVLNEPYLLSSNISKTEYVEISHDDELIGFSFAALDYRVPSKNQYAYMLEGFDEDWIYSGSRRYATYTSLPYGEFTFRVKAANNDGVWNEEGAALSIYIRPPFWTTLWFKVLVAFIVISMIGTMAYLRFNDLQKKKMYLEDQVKLKAQQLKNEKLKSEVAISKAVIEGQSIEQKRISEDLHDGLGQTLTAVNFNLMALEEEIKKQNLQPKHLQNLKDLVNSSILEVRNISHNLMPGLLEDEGLEAALDELCNRASKTSNLKIRLYTKALPYNLGTTIEFSIYRIVQEVISNTLKHANANVLKIIIEYKDKVIYLNTEDDGIGFTTGVNKNGRKGLGLNNISARVELLKGKYHLETAPGEGTKFSIEIPV